MTSPTPVTIEANPTERAQEVWDNWCRTHHDPPPPASARIRHRIHAEHGLPDGWVEVSRYQLNRFAVLTLFSQPDDNWGLLTSHHGSAGGDTLVHTVVTEVFSSLTAMSDGYAHASGKPLVAWLRETISGLYDPTDPVEAAEQALVALGGPVTRIPRAALRSGACQQG